MAQEEIKPYRRSGSKQEQVEAMFDHIAPTYDCLNHALSFGIDHLWRKSAIKTIRKMHPEPIQHILDVATGTGDLALQACHRLNPQTITGCDISEEMMKIGRKKAAEKGLDHHLVFVHENCEKMSFPDETFNVVMSAFALRNFAHLDKCLSEMYRVMKPGGCIVVIDLCAPLRPPMSWVFHLYHHFLMPAVGRMMSTDRYAYRYLPESMTHIVQGNNMAEHFRNAGFKEVAHRYLAFDMCCMYVGRR